MILTPDGKELNTNNAVLYRSTYYYAGFNGAKIQKCKVDDAEVNATAADTSVTENAKDPIALSCPNASSTPASEFSNSDHQKMNTMTLLVTGLRVLLAKCVAVNVLMTVKAFLF